MNILLVYPEMPDTFWTMRYFNKAIGKKSTYPPLGLMTVAAMLPPAWYKKLIDQNIHSLTDEDIQWADLVFLSAMNVQAEAVQRIIQQCKRNGTRIVAGGTLFTHEWERFPDVSYFVLNEAEITLPEFIADFQKGTPKRIYENAGFADIGQTPVPDYSLIDVSHYLYSIIQYSRGCPYMCDFCDVTALFGRRPRTKSPEQVIAELEVITSKSLNTVILFADDNLIGNKKHLKNELLPALIAWRREKAYPLYFATQLTINLADDDELMSMLLEAGFRHIFIGIETPEEEGLALSRKNQNLRRDIMQDIKKLHRTGFIISGGFIVGLDTDRESIFRIQADFIQASGIPLPIVNILKAPPGTELYERISREGRLIRDFTFSEDDTNMRTVMGERVLYEGFRDLTKSIYAPENALKRMKQFLTDYNYPQLGENLKAKYSLKETLGMIGFVLRMSLVYQERIYFWKLVIWAFRHRRKMVQMAIINSLMIRQMNRIYQNMQGRLEHKIKEARAYEKEHALAD